jgi:hypothetical protein
MTALACAFVILGAAALWLDLGNRLFGSYARSALGALVRIALIVAVIVGIASPLVWLWIDPASRAARIAIYMSGFVGAISFAHFLVPYHWGIRRPVNLPQAVETGAISR